MYLMSLRTLPLSSRCNFAPFVDFKRNLFSKEELGVTLFEENRHNTRLEFKNITQMEKYKKHTIKYFSKKSLNDKREIFKKYLFLFDGKPNELENLKSILMDYQHTQRKVFKINDFYFGSQIMRLFYLLNLPDYAIKFYKDVDLKNHFEQMQTKKVMYSLLYENKRYAEVFELYTEDRKRLDLCGLVPDLTINCLAFGCCYHLNTPEHFKYAQDLWQCMKNFRVQMGRSKVFLAAMALKHNAPNYALNLLNNNNTYVTDNYIRLIAFTQLGDLDKACEILRQAILSYTFEIRKPSHKLRYFTANPTKSSFGRQMIEDLQVSIKKKGTEEQLSKFMKIHKDLKALHLINDKTLHEYLCEPLPPMLPENMCRNMKNENITVKYSPNEDWKHVHMRTTQ